MTMARPLVMSGLLLLQVAFCAGSGSAADLRSVEVGPGSLVVAAADGRIAVRDPATGRVGIFAADGRQLTAVAPPAPDGRDVNGMALRDGTLLLAFGDVDGGGMDVELVDIATGDAAAVWKVPYFPGKVFAGLHDWVFEGASMTSPPVVVRVDDLGAPHATLELPAGLADRASAALGSPIAAILRVTAAGGELWGVPGGIYELWRFPGQGSWERFPPPPCLALTGHRVSGDVAVRKALEFARNAPEEHREALLSRLEKALAAGLEINRTFGAVHQVAAVGDRVAVLLEPHPELVDGACRLDVWDVGAAPRVRDARVLQGPCPRFVGLTPDGAWLLHDDGFEHIALGAPSEDPCSEPGPPTGAAGSAIDPARP